MRSPWLALFLISTLANVPGVHASLSHIYEWGGLFDVAADSTVQWVSYSTEYYFHWTHCTIPPKSSKVRAAAVSGSGQTHTGVLFLP